MTKLKTGLINYITLFSSTGTLLCCALPALLVSFGLGAVMAGLATHIPGLILVSENKILVFSFAALMLSLNGVLIGSNRNAPCPVDPKLREACLSGRQMSRRIYFFSLFIFSIGFFFAFIAPQIF